jgi:isoleucyl-tRNA synthetase
LEKFKLFPEDFSYSKNEHKILKFWQKEQIFEKSLDKNKSAKPFSFYEGPPTVNGKPGLHHLMARTIKDTVCRYKSLRGYYVRRQAGWDTHGLPVELAMEKELGLKDKNEIEVYGIDKFNRACKEFVYNNIRMDQGWNVFTTRMGYWVDLNKAYITCENNYIESVWWALKQFFDKGYIYRGFKVVPQSPTIATPLSSHELSLGYKDVRDPNLYLKLKIVSSPIPELVGNYLIVWTTTPWTLLANVALAAGEDIDYVLVENTRKFKSGEELAEKYVLAKSRLSALDGDVKILKEFKGKNLFGTRYEQILPFAKIDIEKYPDALSVLPGDFVSTEEGSGIVHLAPAFGEDDYQMSLKYKIPFLQPVTPDGHFTEDMGEFAGRAIKTFTYIDRVEEGSDRDIVNLLKELGKVYRATFDYLHSYPHCWRTGNPIMYYARNSWFIKSTAYRDQMIELNKHINWQPPEIGEGRFGNWLEEVKDWALSRDRYWGTPLPIWVNDNDKDDFFAIGSIEELLQGLYEYNDGTIVPVADMKEEIDLHKPFVDNIIFIKNNQKYHRTPEVIDVWFDSGSMPFAQFHYPFENQDLFNQQFPADFIAEGVDQTRGWFYTLHNIASALFDKPAFKNIVVNELILDSKGIKMSKSKGNVIDSFEIMEKYGADAVRWYLFVNNPPWKPTLFNPEDLERTVISDFLRSLTNTYTFFAMYANIDNFDPNLKEIPLNERPVIDKWIISRINSIVKQYAEFMDAYELTKAHRLLQDFTINELSNWYIRRNRRRFWKGENDSEKLAAYQTLYFVLKRLITLISSAAPFISEDLYQKLRNDSDPISVHLEDFPEIDNKAIDLELEEKMALIEDIVWLARSLREKARIRVRQPLSRLLIPTDSIQTKREIMEFADIILEELNIKNIEFISTDNTDIIKRKAKPNFKVMGKKFGKLMKTASEAVSSLTTKQIIELEKNGKIELDWNGEHFEFMREDVDIYNEDIEGWLVATDGKITVALDTTIDEKLRQEGIAREFVSKVQNLRKDQGFEVIDRIEILFNANSNLKDAILNMKDYVQSETLAINMKYDENLQAGTEIDILENKVKVIVKKVN